MSQAHHHPDPKKLHIEEDNLDNVQITLIGIASILFLIITVVLMQAWYYAEERSEMQEKVISQPPVEYTQLISSQQERLNSYAWVDRENGVVQIPIEVAMNKAVQELNDEGQAANSAQAANSTAVPQ